MILRSGTTPHALLTTALASALLLSACTEDQSTQPASHNKTVSTIAEQKLSLQALAITNELAVEEAQSLPAQSEWFGAEQLVASARQGLLLLAADGQIKQQLPGRYSTLDSRQNVDGSLTVASFDRVRQQATVLMLRNTEPAFAEPRYLPTADFGIESVCLYRDRSANLYLFLIGEEGRGEQWLLGQQTELLAAPQSVRRLSLPPTAKFCAVDDMAERLYVNEEGIGVWSYPAHPETDPTREVVALIAPHGALASASGLAAIPSGVLILDSEQAQLHRYQQQEGHWQSAAHYGLTGMQAPESLSLQLHDGQAELLIRDDESGIWHRAQLPLPAIANGITSLPEIKAQYQTESVVSEGDAADDPAIWVHPTDASRSRVLGTDKKYGLLVHDLSGKRLQTLASGDINNIDIRSGFRFGNETIDLAVAGNRNHNGLTFYRIDRQSGEVSEIGNVAVPLPDLYGFCLYSPQPGEIHAIPNDKDGRFQQYRLRAEGKQITIELLREFKLASQPEACVADDRRHRLYVGEEDAAVWTLSADPKQPGELTEVMRAGETLQADIEGLGLYHGAQQSYLVISSQGNDSYVVLDAAAPYRVRGVFRIGLNAAAGIDGVSETDGLEVSSANFGGAFSDGLLVVQDGRKRLPQGKQNFKFVAWRDIQPLLSQD